MPAYIVEFVLYGAGDICIEADDPNDAERKFLAIPPEDLAVAKTTVVREVRPLPEHLVPVFRRLVEDHAREAAEGPARPEAGKEGEACIAPPQAGPGVEPAVPISQEAGEAGTGGHYCQFIPAPGSKEGFCLAVADRDTPGHYLDEDGRQVYVPVMYRNPGCGKPAAMEWKERCGTTLLSWWLCAEHYAVVSKAGRDAGSASGTGGSQGPA